MVSHKMRHFFKFLAQKLMKHDTLTWCFVQKVASFVKSLIFHGFLQNEAPLALFFSEELLTRPKHDSLYEKLLVLAKSMI